MVVAENREDAAFRGGPGKIGMLEHVAGAIDARGLAIPYAEDAVLAGTGE